MGVDEVVVGVSVDTVGGGSVTMKSCLARLNPVQEADLTYKLGEKNTKISKVKLSICLNIKKNL